MSSRNLPLPYFPTPPAQYSQAFFAEFLRAFAVYMAQVQNPGEARAITIVLTGLQDNDVGLEPGAVFQVDGVLHVSMANRPYVGMDEMTAAAGSVTVTT